MKSNVNQNVMRCREIFAEIGSEFFTSQPSTYPRFYNHATTKSTVHEIKFGGYHYSCHVNINNLPYSDRYFD